MAYEPTGLAQYFLGVGLPDKENAFFTELKAQFHPNKHVSSPPHITLKPPFYWQDEAGLTARLGKWAMRQPPFAITFSQVGSFRHKKYGTLILTPDKGEDIKRLERSISKSIPPLADAENFSPHLTVGNRVPLGELDEAKRRLREMDITLELVVRSVVLYKHINREPWEPYQEFYFSRRFPLG